MHQLGVTVVEMEWRGVATAWKLLPVGYPGSNAFVGSFGGNLDGIQTTTRSE